MTILLPLLPALAVFLTVRAFKRKKPAALKVLLLLLCLTLLLPCAALLYFSDYYRASERAKALLPDNACKLGTARARFFDGPGEDSALIFYPGAKVEAAAYAPLLRRIADGGVDCYLVEMPLRFALLNIDAADGLIGRGGYSHWVLAGHSLGGVAAASYTASHRDRTAGLVLLAAYPTKELEGLPFLTIYGDRDGVLNRESYEKSRPLWPDGARELVIPGGNHAGFADYGPQRGDGEAEIPPEEYWDRTAEAILDWIYTRITKGTEAA